MENTFFCGSLRPNRVGAMRLGSADAALTLNPNTFRFKEFSEYLLGLTFFNCSALLADNKLRDLFIRWCTLGPEERVFLDENIKTRERFDLYMPLKRALLHWETIQDTQGAPGFDAGLFGFTCDTHLEEELANIVWRVDNIIDRIFIKKGQEEKSLNLLDTQVSQTAS